MLTPFKIAEFWLYNDPSINTIKMRYECDRDLVTLFTLLLRIVWTLNFGFCYFAKGLHILWSDKVKKNSDVFPTLNLYDCLWVCWLHSKSWCKKTWNKRCVANIISWKSIHFSWRLILTEAFWLWNTSFWLSTFYPTIHFTKQG